MAVGDVYRKKWFWLFNRDDNFIEKTYHFYKKADYLIRIDNCYSKKIYVMVLS